MSNYIIKQDGDQYFASNGDFVNLQESEVAFGDSPVQALNAFMSLEEKKELELHPKNCFYCGSVVHDTSEHAKLVRML